MTVGIRILQFYKQLRLDAALPAGVSFMNPYVDDASFHVTEKFYKKYYDDNLTRRIILGINPGRNGGGITGVPFTDPIKLEQDCGIKNDFAKKPELSADFIYRMIYAMGGPSDFYKRFFIGALSPLGFIKDGKNLNYYDTKDLQAAVEPFMIDCLLKQTEFNIDTSLAYCLGEGENLKYLRKLNDRLSIFKRIEGLPHPRFIMQYKRKQIDDYVELYRKQLTILQ